MQQHLESEFSVDFSVLIAVLQLGFLKSTNSNVANLADFAIKIPNVGIGYRINESRCRINVNLRRFAYLAVEQIYHKHSRQRNKPYQDCSQLWVHNSLTLTAHSV